jgi:hypothetical protein
MEHGELWFYLSLVECAVIPFLMGLFSINKNNRPESRECVGSI